MERWIRRVKVGWVLVLVVYFLAWPVGVDPKAWTPPPAPALEGVLAPNDALRAVEVIPTGAGPEDVEVDASGRVVAGLHDGWLVRVGLDGSGLRRWVKLGRPLGLDHDAQGRLWVADAELGLVCVEPDGSWRAVCDTAGGRRFGFTDDVDVGPDGRVYFSDASWKFSPPEFSKDLLEHSPNGRLICWDPARETAEVLAEGLYFANGVAVDPAGRFVLVTETGSYQIQRVWLEGERAGEREVWCENLPGFPDGIAADGDGYWLALAAPRNPALDALSPWPFVRKVLLRIPEEWAPRPSATGHVLRLSGEGEVLGSWSGGRYGPTTSVERFGEWVYLGSLSYPGVGRLRASALGD